MASWFVSNAGSDSNAGTSIGTAFATIGKGISSAASGDTINVQTGTYPLTASLSITLASLTISGFQTSPGDNGTPPLITTSTNSVTLINTSSSSGGVWIFNNLSLSNTAATSSSGIWQLSPHGTSQTWVFVRCKFAGFIRGIDCSDGTPDDVAFIQVIGCEFTGNTLYAINTGGTTLTYMSVYGCYFHGNVQDMLTGPNHGPVSISYCIFAGSTAAFDLQLSTLDVVIDHCTFANNVNASGTLSFNTSNNFASVTNCIFYGSTGAGYAIGGGSAHATAAAVAAGSTNAFGNNTTNRGSPWTATPGDVTLTASPFTNASAGDYSLNSTAGGGALCKGAGFPGVFPGGTSTGHADIGAVQTAGAAAVITGFIY